MLLKLNSREEVAVWISSTKTARGKGGGISLPLYRGSLQISMISASGTLVKRLTDIIEAKKDRWRKVKSFDFISKSKGIRNTVGRKK